MSKKLYIPILLLVICLLGMTAAFVTSNQKYEKKDEMPTFPSYDWSSEDDTMLAYVSANTPGSDRDKQEAIIIVLGQVWANKVSITEYVERHYELYNKPTQKDYHLVDLIIKHEWASDEK